MGRKQREIMAQSKLQSPSSSLHPNQSMFRIVERQIKRRYQCKCDRPLNRHTFGCRIDVNALNECIDLDLAINDQLESIVTHQSIHYQPQSLFIQSFSHSVDKGTTISSDTLQMKDEITLNVIGFTQFPGLFVMRDAFTPQQQKQLITRCLNEYTMHPNKTNHSKFYRTPETESLWNLKQSLTSQLIHPKEQDEIETDGPNGDEVYDVLPRLPIMTSTTAIQTLRWTSLGMQYNWFTKKYKTNLGHIKVPTLVSSICEKVVQVLQGLTGHDLNKYKAEAGIINYYGYGDALMAHQDRSEFNMHAPLISIR